MADSFIQLPVTGGTAATITASRACVSDGAGLLIAATTTATEIGYVNGVTSAIQTQLTAKAPLASPSLTGTVTLPSGSVTSSAWSFGASTFTGSGIATFTGSTASSSTSTGEVVVTGGLGVGGATYIGGLANVAGNTTLVGLVGIGSTGPTAGIGLYHTHNDFTGTTQSASYSATQYKSGATSLIADYASVFSTQNASFVTSVAAKFYATGITKGAAHTITRAINFYGAPESVGTNNANLADNTAFTGNFFIHQTGTDPSTFRGDILFGANNAVKIGDGTNHLSSVFSFIYYGASNNQYIDMTTFNHMDFMLNTFAVDRATGYVKSYYDVQIVTAGTGVQIKDGANCKMGQSVMVGGTVTVANTSVTANSRIFLSVAVAGGVQGVLSVGTVTAGTSFVINSSAGTDTSTVNWLLIEKL